MRSFKRADRVAPLILEILADVIRHRIRDQLVKKAVLTRIDIGDDLRLAKVFYQVLDDSDRTEVAAGLERATGFLRRELSRQLEMKFVPELRFKYDDSQEHINKVEQILRSLKPGEES